MKRVAGIAILPLAAVLAVVLTVALAGPASARGTGGVARVRTTYGYSGWNTVGDTTLVGRFSLNGAAFNGTVQIAGWLCGFTKGVPCGYQPSTPLSGTTRNGGTLSGTCSGMYARGQTETLDFQCSVSKDGGTAGAMSFHVAFDTAVDDLRDGQICFVFPCGLASTIPFRVGTPYDGVYTER